jgi:hypothetical protein
MGTMFLSQYNLLPQLFLYLLSEQKARLGFSNISLLKLSGLFYLPPGFTFKILLGARFALSV